jgi:plastocyanin
MLISKLRLLTLIFLGFITSIDSAFSQTRLKIVDQNNVPLANAVVEYAAAIPAQQAVNEQIYIMDQVNKQFVPHVLVIPENSFVSFPNSDDIRHHVYSFSSAKTFELKLYAGKPKSPVQFNKKGLVVMGCNIHDSMVGYIYVSDNAHTFISNEKGEILLTDSLPNNTQLQVWHPDSALGLSKHTRFTINQSMLDADEIILKIGVSEPEPGDSFEELHLHEH